MRKPLDLPERSLGEWKVETFTVSKEDERFGMMRAVISGSSRGRYVPAGTYHRLRRGGTTVMSDTPDEMRDCRHFIRRAKGNVLINGLGLGAVLVEVLDKDEVEHVTVIENSPEVIELVGEHYRKRYGERLEIVQADAFEYSPPKGARYDAVWHDIWDNICSDNLSEMTKLHRKYGKRTAWQDSWGKDMCLAQRKRGWW